MHIVCKRPRKMGREGSTKTYKVIGAWPQYGAPRISHLTKTSHSCSQLVIGSWQQESLKGRLNMNWYLCKTKILWRVNVRAEKLGVGSKELGKLSGNAILTKQKGTKGVSREQKEIQPPHPSSDLYPSANNYNQPSKLQMQQGLTLGIFLSKTGSIKHRQ